MSKCQTIDLAFDTFSILIFNLNAKYIAIQVYIDYNSRGGVQCYRPRKYKKNNWFDHKLWLKTAFRTSILHVPSSRFHFFENNCQNINLALITYQLKRIEFMFRQFSNFRLFLIFWRYFENIFSLLRSICSTKWILVITKALQK